MPTICRFCGIEIGMFYNDHAPPHFHVKYAEFEAEIVIGTLETKDGWIPRRAQRLVDEWATRHQAELMDNWERARRSAALNQIEGLE
jgi:hypothetical protein